MTKLFLIYYTSTNVVEAAITTEQLTTDYYKNSVNRVQELEDEKISNKILEIFTAVSISQTDEEFLQENIGFFKKIHITCNKHPQIPSMYNIKVFYKGEGFTKNKLIWISRYFPEDDVRRIMINCDKYNISGSREEKEVTSMWGVVTGVVFSVGFILIGHKLYSFVIKKYKDIQNEIKNGKDFDLRKYETFKLKKSNLPEEGYMSCYTEKTREQLQSILDTNNILSNFTPSLDGKSKCMYAFMGDAGVGKTQLATMLSAKIIKCFHYNGVTNVKTLEIPNNFLHTQVYAGSSNMKMDNFFNPLETQLKKNKMGFIIYIDDFSSAFEQRKDDVSHNNLDVETFLGKIDSISSKFPGQISFIFTFNPKKRSPYILEESGEEPHLDRAMCRRFHLVFIKTDKTFKSMEHIVKNTIFQLISSGQNESTFSKAEKESYKEYLKEEFTEKCMNVLRINKNTLFKNSNKNKEFTPSAFSDDIQSFAIKPNKRAYQTINKIRNEYMKASKEKKLEMRNFILELMEQNNKWPTELNEIEEKKNQLKEYISKTKNKLNFFSHFISELVFNTNSLNENSLNQFLKPIEFFLNDNEKNTDFSFANFMDYKYNNKELDDIILHAIEKSLHYNDEENEEEEIKINKNNTKTSKYLQETVVEEENDE